MQTIRLARRWFVALWVVTLAVRLVIAARLPLFVDEAFYWQESRHPALAYSDLPGLTAWLIRLGTELGGQQVLAVRMPFLAMGAALPWLLVAMARRWFGARHAWHAGSLALLMPMSATVGVLALPDVPLVFASALCLWAGARLLEQARWSAVLLLAAGLAIGALSHYRFAWVILVGGMALACVPEGRRLFRNGRLWLGLAIGAAAWLPLLLWNVEHGEAGLRFQLLDRHPWRFHLAGLWFPLIQAAVTTPLLFVAMLVAGAGGRRRDVGATPQRCYFAWSGLISTIGIFALGFFTDIDRVSFHWPLSGYLALLILVPATLDRWKPAVRRITWGLAALGSVGACGYCLMLTMPSARVDALPEKLYLRNFAGWEVLAEAVQTRLDSMPANTRLLADNFKVGAELGFVMNDADIAVLDHPLNRKHGRAPQLRLWGLERGVDGASPQLLVLSVGDIPYRDLLRRYHDVCAMVGPIGSPQTVSIDHGAQRFLLVEVPAPARVAERCVTPAMAWIDAPAIGADVPRHFDVAGWAFKDGTGLARVQVLLDGDVVADADYGSENDAGSYWKISTDPHHPRIGFRAEVRLPGGVSGRHWLGLRLHGTDGSVEDWNEQPVNIVE